MSKTPNTAVASDDIVREAIAAIEADTPELEAEIGGLNSLIYALVKKAGLTPAQLAEAVADAFSDELSEDDPDDRATLSEGTHVEDFINTYR